MNGLSINGLMLDLLFYLLEQSITLCVNASEEVVVCLYCRDITYAENIEA